MTQKILKYILNMFLKSVTKTDLDSPPQKMLHFSFISFEGFP